jgi:hypothetical protein
LRDAEEPRQVGEQLRRRRQLLRRLAGAGDGADSLRVGAGEPRHQARVRAERDHLPGWQRPVVLRDREVFVDDAAALQGDVAHDLPLLEPHDDHERAHAVGHLAPEAAEHFRLAVGQLVVRRGPPVARGEHHAPLRPAGESWDELAHRADDRVDVVGLHVDRAERRLPPCAEVLFQRPDRRL